MKKNVMMRLASFLLVAVLISTSAISGTYAKYVTEGTSDDKARVAHFGVTVTADDNIFESAYKGTEAGWTTKDTVSAAEDVVAPGTSDSMANISIAGIPEVAVRITNDVKKFDIGDNWVVGGAFYCPLVFTVYDAAGASHAISGLDYANATAFEDAVISAIETAKAEYDPGFDLSTLSSDKILKIDWAWAFVGSNDSADLTYGQTDAKDTALGDAANKGTIDLEVITYVTQID